jgi:hypothetical protein
MERLVKGFLKFRTEVFGKKKALFTRLSKNQTPWSFSVPRLKLAW